MRYVLTSIFVLFTIVLAPRASAECFNPQHEYDVFFNGLNDAFKERGVQADIVLLDDAQRGAFLEDYNSTPPVSGLMYERVAFAIARSAQRSLILFIQDGCVWEAQPAPTLSLLRFIEPVDQPL